MIRIVEAAVDIGNCSIGKRRLASTYIQMVMAISTFLNLNHDRRMIGARSLSLSRGHDHDGTYLVP